MVNRDALRARLVAIVEELRAAPAKAKANADADAENYVGTSAHALAGQWAYRVGGLEASCNIAVRQLDGVLEHLLPPKKGSRP